MKKKIYPLPLLFFMLVAGNAYPQSLNEVQNINVNIHSNKPNVIFILADDLGWGDLGAYGNQKIHTPNLDRLAQEGTLFTNFYANAPVCAPSRTAFFTGRYPEASGAYSNKDDSNGIDVPTTLPNLATVFKSAGYRTFHTGKWHLSPKKTPDQYGFDEYKMRETGSWGKKQKDPYFRAHSTRYFVEDVVDFIEKVPGKPFYAQLWAILPHDILFPTEEQMARYEAYDMRKKFKIPGFPFTSAEQIYYASVTTLDDHLGRLFHYLDSTGLSKNTIVVFASDNGPGIMEALPVGHSAAGSSGPFRGRKNSIYEGGIRMPLIVKWPGHAPEGSINDTTVIAGMDFLPTLASIIGSKVPEKLDGLDLSAAWEGNRVLRPEPVFWRWRFHMPPQLYHRSPILAMRDGNWKLMMNPDGSRKELYNLSEDPTELDNLSKEDPKRTAEMQEQLLEWNKKLPSAGYAPGAGKNNYNWPGSIK